MAKTIPPKKVEEPPIDPTPYIELVRKNTEKLSKKSSQVVVEDNYVQPTDFRDPGRRRDGSVS